MNCAIASSKYKTPALKTVRRAIGLPFYGLAWIFGILSVIMVAIGVLVSGEDIPL
jgi:hypothetical protein